MKKFLVTLTCTAEKIINLQAESKKECEQLVKDNYEKYWSDFIGNAEKTYDEDDYININDNGTGFVILHCLADYSFIVESESKEKLERLGFETEWEKFTGNATKTYGEDINIYELK